MTGVANLPPAAVDMLESIHQHRLLDTQQLHVLHAPHASIRWTQRLAAALARRGLIDHVPAAKRRRLHFATVAGADAVETLGSRVETRRTVVRPEQAAGPLRRHTLAVNDVGISFVQAARDNGDECGPWAWRHEIAHPIGGVPGQYQHEQLISDALLTYQRTRGGRTSFHYRLIELDRATMPVDDLAAKITRYVRLYHYAAAPAGALDDPVPVWTHRYSVFPTVLVVLANGTRQALERRRDTLLALCREDQELQDGRTVRVDVCLMDELRARGPFAPIFRTVERSDTPATWLGDTPR
jgi:hypothetical protein